MVIRRGYDWQIVRKAQDAQKRALRRAEIEIPRGDPWWKKMAKEYFKTKKAI